MASAQADTWIVGCLLATAAFVGCGEESQPGHSTRPEHQQIVAVLATMEHAIGDHDATRLCTDVYAFQGSTTTAQCVRALQPALARARAKVSITVETVRRDGPRATATAMTRGLSSSSRPARQTFSLVREHGRWRVLYE